MDEDDIRWQRCFSNYKKALAQLSKFMDKKDLNELEGQGLVHVFKYTHELAWKTLSDFLKDRGVERIYGSKDATREAFNIDLVQDGQIWMDMIKSRNLTSHTYNEEVTEEIIESINQKYFKAFKDLENNLDELVK